jgi:hypothetical protein
MHVSLTSATLCKSSLLYKTKIIQKYLLWTYAASLLHIQIQTATRVTDDGRQCHLSENDHIPSSYIIANNILN